MIRIKSKTNLITLKEEITKIFKTKIIKIFNYEEIFFNHSKSFYFAKRRCNIKIGRMPNINDAMILYLLTFYMLVYLGKYVQLKFGIIGTVMTQIMILIIPILLAYYIKTNFKKVFYINLPTLNHILGSFCIWLGTNIGSIIIIQMVLYIYPQNVEVVENLNRVLLNKEDLLINIIVIAIMPAICEELFFRGFMFSALRNNRFSTCSAIIGSGILFGIMHMDFIRIIPTSLLGISFAYVVYKSNSIFTSMFMHFFNNIFALLVTNLMFVKITTNIPKTAIIFLSHLVTGLFLSIFFIKLGIILLKNKNFNFEVN